MKIFLKIKRGNLNSGSLDRRGAVKCGAFARAATKEARVSGFTSHNLINYRMKRDIKRIKCHFAHRVLGIFIMKIIFKSWTYIRKDQENYMENTLLVYLFPGRRN